MTKEKRTIAKIITAYHFKDRQLVIGKARDNTGVTFRYVCSFSTYHKLDHNSIVTGHNIGRFFIIEDTTSCLSYLRLIK